MRCYAETHPQTFEPQSAAWRRAWACIIALLIAVTVAAPARAGGITLIQSITGVETGERIRGEVNLGARAGGAADAIYYKLTGPASIEVVRSGKQTSFMVDEEGNPVAWDTTTVPDGIYKLVVYSRRDGEFDRFRFIQFRVDNLTPMTPTDTVQDQVQDQEQQQIQQPEESEPEVVVTPEPEVTEPEVVVTPEPEVTEPEVVVTPEPEVTEPEVVVTPEPEETEPEVVVTPEPEVTEPEVIVTPEPEVTEPEVVVDPEPAPQPAPAEPFNAAFADLSTTYQHGSGEKLALSTGGELNEDQTLMVLAWSVAEQRMVSEFAFSLTEGPWEIPASKLALLPVGVNNIQLHVRQGTTTIKRVTRDIDFLKAVVPFEIAFVNAPSSYELGSGQSVSLNATGDMEEGADVLVVAWSITQGKMVDGFGFSLDKAPWHIPASRLDMLPEGQAEIQLITRDSRRHKVVHQMSVAAPLPVAPEMTLATSSFTLGQASAMSVGLSSAVPDECELVALAWSAGESRMVSEFEHTLSKTQPVIAADKLNLLPEGTNNVRLQVRYNGQVLAQTAADVQVQPVPEPEPEPEPVATTDPAVSFVSKPAQYQIGSGASIDFAVENLPDGGDVLILAWSDAQGAMVSGFGHYLRGEPWTISASRLDTLPAGTVELQLIVRGGDVRPKATHRLEIVSPITAPSEGGSEVVVEPTPDPEPTTDPTTDPGTETDPTTDPTTDPGTETDPTTDPTTDPATDPADITGPDLSGLTAATVGFTTLSKSADTRVIYVSASTGNDNNDGLSEQKPVKTLAKAQSLLRHKYPDWMLLKAGDVWDGESLPAFDKCGRSDSQPMVIGVYGDGPRPTIIPPHNQHGIKTTYHFIHGLVIQGLRIYPATRDPESPRYISRPSDIDGINVRINASENKQVTGLLIEDCEISYFDSNIKVVDDWTRYQGQGLPGRIQCVIRRNILRFASTDGSHAVGLYIEGSRDSVIEQNLLDHNGWGKTDGNATRNKKSHNIYAQGFNGPLTVRDNILTRAAAHGLQLRAGGNVERNLFVRNAAGFYCSRNDSKALYNVIMESEDMNPDVPQDWRGYGLEGFSLGKYEVIGNVITRRAGTLNKPGIEVYAGQLTIKDNIVYKWADNRINVSIVYEGNATMSANLTPGSFNGQDPPYVDPDRDMGDYAGSIGLTPTFEAFLEAAASRPRGQWIADLSAENASRYIRNGFELLPHD